MFIYIHIMIANITTAFKAQESANTAESEACTQVLITLLLCLMCRLFYTVYWGKLVQVLTRG